MVSKVNQSPFIISVMQLSPLFMVSATDPLVGSDVFN